MNRNQAMPNIIPVHIEYGGLHVINPGMGV